jgi:hypothetical protein
MTEQSTKCLCTLIKKGYPYELAQTSREVPLLYGERENSMMKRFRRCASGASKVSRFHDLRARHKLELTGTTAVSVLHSVQFYCRCSQSYSCVDE